jgi:hypothetical protein
MIIEKKRNILQDIYNDFESSVQIYKAGAICKIGCAFCCTHFGNVDIISLEGFIIHAWIQPDIPDTSVIFFICSIDRILKNFIGPEDSTPAT